MSIQGTLLSHWEAGPTRSFRGFVYRKCRSPGHLRTASFSVRAVVTRLGKRFLRLTAGLSHRSEAPGEALPAERDNDRLVVARPTRRAVAAAYLYAGEVGRGGGGLGACFFPGAGQVFAVGAVAGGAGLGVFTLTATATKAVGAGML
ncbi:hypothetical protein SAMN05216483_6324 [Streptomyces sp. 2131.1]|nr:hypothetical protein SAMN05216483_6324 [Streptomyces sp. 2131.1]